MFNLFKKKTKKSIGYLTVTMKEFNHGHVKTVNYIFNKVSGKFEECELFIIENCNLFEDIFDCKSTICNKREYKKFLAKANAHGAIHFVEMTVAESKSIISPQIKTTRFYYVPSQMMLELWNWRK